MKIMHLIFLSSLTLSSIIFSDTFHPQNIPYCQYSLGSSIGPITPKSPNDLPVAKPVPVMPAKETLWKSSALGFIPTNDWFEQMAAWHTEKTATNTSGLYCMSWNLEEGGMTFNVPTNFHYIPDAGNPAHGYIAQDLDSGFSIGATELNDSPTVCWEPSETGNMLRNISYHNDGLVIHAVQGSVFQSASYNGLSPDIQLPSGGIFSQSQLSQQNVTKYRIETSTLVYFVYSPSKLSLTYDAQTGKLTSSSGPYTGSINVASLLKDTNLKTNEATLDCHSNVVITHAQGDLLIDNTYSFTYATQDLLGAESTTQPLIFLKQHHRDDLQADSVNQKTTLTFTTLTGTMQAYAGSLFTFKLTPPRASTNPLPSPGITPAQAEVLINGKVLQEALDSTSNMHPGAIVYNKGIFQQALTLDYAAKVLKSAGHSQDSIASTLSPLYAALQNAMDQVWSIIQRDKDWGTTVSKNDDYGQHSNLNDHIVQYGYPLYALTLLKTYEDIYVTGDKYLDKNSSIPGYTNKDLGDVLASDIGETGESVNPLHRNLDLYEGHSWLSGIGKALGAGNNTESESEALLGSMSVLAWLEATQNGSDQEKIAQTRWSLESKSFHTYYQNTENSPYNDVSTEFVKNHPVVSLIWQGKICDETWWGNDWDRIIACENMPASANLMDNYLDTTPAYIKRLADYVISNWDNFDDKNTIQSVLIAVVAKTDPATADKFIDFVKQKNYFDPGTNEFILRVISSYAENQQKEISSIY